MSTPELIELPSTIASYSVDRPIGIDLGMENIWAGQYIRKNGKNYVKILKIGGNNQYSLWSGVAFNDRTINVGEAAKVIIATRKSQKKPINGAYQIKEFLGVAYNKIDVKSIPFPVYKDPFGRIGILIRDESNQSHITPEEISLIFIKAVLNDLKCLYGIINPQVVITQSDRICNIDAVLIYGVLKVHNVDIDKIISDSQAAITAYGVEIDQHDYIVFNFSESECYCTLIRNGKPKFYSKNNICGKLLKSVKNLKNNKDQIKKIKEGLINMIKNVMIKSDKIDGVVLVGDAQNDAFIKDIINNVFQDIPIYDSIPSNLVIVVGTTVFAAKRLQEEIEMNRPLYGILQEMEELRLSMGLHEDSINPLFGPPSYDTIVNHNPNSDAPPAWSPPRNLSGATEIERL